jgi:hypothetical protein
MANDSKVNISQIVRYSVTRIVKTVNEVSLSGDQLINPEVIDRWVPDTQNSIKIIHKKIHEAIGSLKNSQKQMDEKSEELLDFIEDELLKSKNPRKFLIESALFSLQTNSIFQDNKELQKMDEIVKEYINERLKLET